MVGFRVGAVGVLVLVLSGVIPAGEIEFRRPVTSPRFRLAPPAPPPPLFESGGLSVYGLAASERERGELLFRLSAGDGAGAALSELALAQTAYLQSDCPDGRCDPPSCNIVRMLWVETTLEASGVDVILDDILLDTVAGLPPGEVGGINGVDIRNVPPGPHTFRIESQANGSSAELQLDVLETLPFSTPGGLTCSEGAVGGEGTCQLIVEFENEAPFPTAFFVDVDGALLESLVRGDLSSFAIEGAPPGEHCVGLRGVLDNGDGTLYLGCRAESCCTLECVPAACNAPRNLLVCQVGYGAAGGTLRASWDNSEPFYDGGLAVTLDGVPMGSGPGDADTAFIVSPLGAHDVGIFGDCDADGPSDVTEASFVVLAETPHPSPVVEGSPMQEWADADGGTTTATWENDAPSAFIDVFVLSDGLLAFVGTIGGAATSVDVIGTLADDVLVLQFFAFVDGGCYGSGLVATGSTDRRGYVPGDCNRDDQVNIADASNILNFLFLGAARPVCLAGCDTNDDGGANIADASYLLNFLFVGGPPPPAWDGESARCVTLTDEDCDEPSASCAQ